MTNRVFQSLDNTFKYARYKRNTCALYTDKLMERIFNLCIIYNDCK